MANEQQVPKLDPDWSQDGSRLTPAEGFLLSRIDGRTPWAELRLIAGIPPADVDRCLERWLSEGILTVNGAAPKPVRAADCDFEAGIDLTADEQRRICEFERTLDRPYHAVLGVERDADARAIKRAYFELSKEFHPDRYYRRQLGGFGPRIERIFRKIIEAHELLSDPATRAEIDRVQAPPTPADARPTAATGPSANTVSNRRAVLERLRRQFKVPEKVMIERRFKAKQFYQAATIAERKERWLEAGASIRLAISFDPWDDQLKQAFLRIQSQVHQVRAAELLAEADASMDAKAQQGAMRMLEEALSYRPCDPEINQKAAALALDLGDLDAALEYAQAACDLTPDSSPNYRMLAKVYAKSGRRDKAIVTLERALEVDPKDASLKAELQILNRNRGRKR